ncbi:hypothetical protein AAG906_006768 [Vitis piasezkii]
MLFNLDLFLLEVLFVYTLKKGKKDIFSMFAYIPSLQLVTNLLDSNKGEPKGTRDCLVEWVEKASFDRLNKLFEINAIKRHHQTLLSAGIYWRWLPKVVVPKGHFVLKDLSFYAKARQEDLDQREEKRHEGTLRKAPDEKGYGSSPTVHPPATNKKKKTLSRQFFHSFSVRPIKRLHPASEGGRRYERFKSRVYGEAPQMIVRSNQHCLSPSQKGLPREGLGGSGGGASPSIMPHSDVAGPSAVAVTQPNVAGPSAAAIQPDADAPNNALAAEEVCGPPSWGELMEMLKEVSCFTDAEAPSTKMSNFFPLTKRISVNMAPLSLLCLVSSICRMDSARDCRSAYSRHPKHDAIACTTFQAAGGGRGYAGLHLPPPGRY